MNSRRDFLSHLSSLSVLAGRAETPALRYEMRSGDASDSLRWPKPIGSPALESIRPAIENSRDVFTHVEKIVEVAGWMQNLSGVQWELRTDDGQILYVKKLERKA